MQTWALSVFLLFRFSVDDTVHGVPVVCDHSGRHSKCAGTLAAESSLLQLSDSAVRMASAAGSRGHSSQLGTGIDPLGEAGGAPMLCEAPCRSNGQTHSCLERVQWVSTQSGGSATVATAVDRVNGECAGQCVCSVADVHPQPSGNLPSTTPQQSTQTSEAVESTTVETTGAVSSMVVGMKNFLDLGVTLELELDDVVGEVILRLAGPSDVWFGIGFNAFSMAERPYAVIVDGSTGSVHERKLGKYSAGDLLVSSLEEVSPPSYINGRCHVELRRSLAGNSPFHFSFSPAASSLNLIAAVGWHSSFSFHAARDADVMSLVRQ